MSKTWHVIYLTIIAVLLVYKGRELTADETTRFQSALIDHTGNYSNVNWLGVPIWQPVLDLWTIQETIFEIKPSLLVECGTYKGGSSMFFAQLLT